MTIVTDSKKKSSRVPTPPPPPITHNFTSIDLLDEPATQETIDLINEDEFVPKTFTSSKNHTDKVVIDLNTQTITVPTPDTSEDVQNTLFHPNVSISVYFQLIRFPDHKVHQSNQFVLLYLFSYSVMMRPGWRNG